MTKLLSELTSEDFERFKVWVYQGDSDAVATVEPSSKPELVEDDGSVYLAATQFRLADGSSLNGFSSPTDDSGLDYVQPVIFYDGRLLRLWNDQSGVEDLSEVLGKKKSDIYPIRWLSDVRVDGEVRSGSIEIAEIEDEAV